MLKLLAGSTGGDRGQLSEKVIVRWVSVPPLICVWRIQAWFQDFVVIQRKWLNSASVDFGGLFPCFVSRRKIPTFFGNLFAQGGESSSVAFGLHLAGRHLIVVGRVKLMQVVIHGISARINVIQH